MSYLLLLGKTSRSLSSSSECLVSSPKFLRIGLYPILVQLCQLYSRPAAFTLSLFCQRWCGRLGLKGLESCPKEVCVPSARTRTI